MNFRFEKKLYLHHSLYPDINILLKTFDIFLKQEHKDRTVNSIYFDTYNFDCYYESILGNKERKKYRLRWYGDEIKTQPSLEIKKKEGNVGTKIIYPLDFINLNNLGNLCQLNNYMNKSKIPYDLKSFLISCYPTLYCSYNRKYYITNNKMLRLTFDKKICYSRVKNNFLRDKLNLVKDENTVIEIKYDSSQEFTDFKELLPLNLQSTRFSKYTNGIDLLIQTHN